MQTKTIIAAIALAFAGAASAQEVVKIGYVGPLSGQSAHLGKDNQSGVRMAVEDLNAKGFKVNGKAVKFEMVSEDDAGDPKQGTSAAQKLVDAKVQGVIGPSPLPKSTSTQAFRRFRHRQPARCTPTRASTPRSAWWQTTSSWAARWVNTPRRNWAPSVSRSSMTVPLMDKAWPPNS
jgi:hypothetical protein